MDNVRALLERLRGYRYPLLILLLGLILLALPTGGKAKTEEPTASGALEQALRDADGVGRVRVLVSEKGAVVVCDGADNAAVRWSILQAIGSYTGLGTDKSIVLKMTT